VGVPKGRRLRLSKAIHSCNMPSSRAADTEIASVTRYRPRTSGRERLRLSLVVGELKYDLWGLLSERKSRYWFLYVGDHNPHAFRGA
jgi:hypothetical protein